MDRLLLNLKISDTLYSSGQSDKLFYKSGIHKEYPILSLRGNNVGLMLSPRIFYHLKVLLQIFWKISVGSSPTPLLMQYYHTCSNSLEQTKLWLVSHWTYTYILPSPTDAPLLPNSLHWNGKIDQWYLCHKYIQPLCLKLPILRYYQDQTKEYHTSHLPEEFIWFFQYFQYL